MGTQSSSSQVSLGLNHLKTSCDLGLGRPGDKATPYPLQSISSAESYSLMYNGFAKHAHAASTTVAVCTQLVLPYYM